MSDLRCRRGYTQLRLSGSIDLTIQSREIIIQLSLMYITFKAQVNDGIEQDT